MISVKFDLNCVKCWQSEKGDVSFYLPCLFVCTNLCPGNLRFRSTLFTVKEGGENEQGTHIILDFVSSHLQVKESVDF